MSAPGRPKALGAEKQATVCSLVAAGVSLRQAAGYVGCDPRSIRREAQRNDEFRRQLAKAKSQASIHPLETLRQAAKADWRAALCWMERLDPDRFARPDASVVTKREANQFVADLIASIERAVSNPDERADLYKLLSPAMPAAMRRRWDVRQVRRNSQQAMRVHDQLKRADDERKRAQRKERDLRRHNLFREIAPHLPDDLYEKLSWNSDLLDPEEALAERPHARAHRTGAPVAPHVGASLTNNGLTSDDVTNNASPAENFVPPPRRILHDMAPPPPTNLALSNDLPPRGEANSSE